MRGWLEFLVHACCISFSSKIAQKYLTKDELYKIYISLLSKIDLLLLAHLHMIIISRYNKQMKIVYLYDFTLLRFYCIYVVDIITSKICKVYTLILCRWINWLSDLYFMSGYLFLPPLCENTVRSKYVCYSHTCV